MYKGILFLLYCKDNAFTTEYLHTTAQRNGRAILALCLPIVTIQFNSTIAILWDCFGDYADASDDSVGIALTLHLFRMNGMEYAWAYKHNAQHRADGKHHDLHPDDIRHQTCQEGTQCTDREADDEEITTT